MLPITLATQMLQTLPAQRPRAMEVLQHSWLEPPLFGTDTPVPRQPLNQAAPPAMDAPLSSGGPAQPTPGVAALILKGQPLPSSEGPAQLSPDVAALEASSRGHAQLSPGVAALKVQLLRPREGPPWSLTPNSATLFSPPHFSHTWCRGTCQPSLQRSDHSASIKVTFCCTAFWLSPNTPRCWRTSPLAWPSCRSS